VYKTFLLLFGVPVLFWVTPAALADSPKGRSPVEEPPVVEENTRSPEKAAINQNSILENIAISFSKSSSLELSHSVIEPSSEPIQFVPAADVALKPIQLSEPQISVANLTKDYALAQVTSQVPAVLRETPAAAAQTVSKQIEASFLEEVPDETVISVSELLNVQSATLTVQGSDEANSPADDMAQVTSVTQLSDVQPTDWAFQALQSLVERYGVIAGYPNGTFRGDRAITRYEFAAGLNAALDRINELIAAGTADRVSKDDLETLRRLQEEFAPELAALRGRIDNLEVRTAELEANQFSTTTVFGGEVIFAIADAFGGDPPGGCRLLGDIPDVNPNREVDCIRRGDPDTNTVLTHLVRLGLETSFTGKDRLRTYLVSGNFDNGGFTNAESLNTYMARLSYQAGLNNEVILDLLEYRFPAFGDRVVFSVIPFGFSLSNVLSANSPYFDVGRGAISRFGEESPIFRLGGVLDAGAGFDWLISEKVRLQVAYGTGSSGNPEGGLFGGDRSALGAQFLLQPFENVLAGITYVNAYTSDGTLGTFTGSVNAETLGLWSGSYIPPVNANSVFPCCSVFVGDLAAQINAVGGSLQWRITPKLTFGAWGGYISANFLEELPDSPDFRQPPPLGIGASAGKKPFANAATFLFSLGLSEPFGREGDLLAFLFGMPPKLVDAGPETPGTPVPFFETSRRGEPEVPVTDNNRDLDTFAIAATNPIDQPARDLPRRVGQEDEATSLHFEVFYRFRVNDNLYITPGFFIVTNPGHIADNDTILVGTIRTTFRF